MGSAVAHTGVSTASTVMTRTTTSTSLNVFGNKKSKAQKEAEAEREAMYWEGEWVCKDCGYIYNRGECAGLFFEEQTGGSVVHNALVHVGDMQRKLVIVWELLSVVVMHQF